MRHSRPPATSPLRTSRRGFLRLLGAGAAFASVARIRAVPAAASAPDVGPTSTFFSTEETEILTQVVERMVDTGDARAPAVRETRTLRTIDGLCASLDASLSGSLHPLMRLVDWGPLLFELQPKRFTSMTPSEKDASLRGWMTSRFQIRRTAFQALRNLAMLGYYAQEETWPLVGYQGPLLRRGGRPG